MTDDVITHIYMYLSPRHHMEVSGDVSYNLSLVLYALNYKNFI